MVWDLNISVVNVYSIELTIKAEIFISIFSYYICNFLWSVVIIIIKGIIIIIIIIKGHGEYD